MAGTITMGAQNPAAMDKLVLKDFVEGAKGTPTSYKEVYNIETPTRRNEKFTITKNDAGVFEVEDGAAAPKTPTNEIGINTISQRLFKKAVVTGDFAAAFDNYGAIANASYYTGNHFVAQLDIMGADFLNNATSTSGNYGINVAGITTALVSTAQPIGDSGFTQSNRVSGSLDKSTINSAKILMRRTKDHSGLLSTYTPSRLVIPPEEEQNAWQLCMSTDEPESANRNLNYTKTIGLRLITWTRLKSTTACFMMSQKGRAGMRGLRYEIKITPTVRRVQGQDTDNWQYNYRMMAAPGVVDYLGLVSIGL